MRQVMKQVMKKIMKEIMIDLLIHRLKMMSSTFYNANNNVKNKMSTNVQNYG